MNKTQNGITILDHDAGVLVYSYEFAPGASSNMFVARMADGKLMVVSPSSRTPDPVFEDLLAYGDIGALVANNGFHHLGQAEWKARFPEARCFAPAEGWARIKKKNPAAPSFEPLTALAELLGPDLFVGECEATKCGESWAWVKTEAGYIWYLSDLLANMQALPSNFLVRMMMKLTKSAPGYKVFHGAQMFILRDKKGAMRRLLEEMQAHPPAIVVPAHGPPLAHPELAEDTYALLREVI